MITTDTYHRQIDRIEGAFNYKIDSNALHVWHEELNKNNITDTDLIAAVNSGLSKGGWEIRPHLGALLTKCHYAKSVRVKAEQKRIADQEDRSQTLGVGDLLERGATNRSSKVLKWCELTTKRLKGDVDIETFNRQHKEIGRG